jgi:hypothetical protein
MLFVTGFLLLNAALSVQVIEIFCIFEFDAHLGIFS